jgi:predicted nucleic acid-binding protein
VILVDSSVWIDFFRGKDTPQVERLDALFAQERIAVGDLIMTEVLQGFRSERDFNQARKTLETFEFVDLGGADIAVKAAKNFRTLQALGFTVRKTIDTIIATKCIEADYSLLHADRDFEPFRSHLGLRVDFSEGNELK